jgi:hypothetical protein
VGHTPGPWIADFYEKFGIVGDISTTEGVSVAQAQSCQPLAAGKKDMERFYNSLLIAAAPELLEALENLIRSNSPEHINAAIDAVAKARGTTNET